MSKFLKISIRIAGGLLLLGVLVFGICYAIYNESLPEGKTGPAADVLATKMLTAINNDGYKNTRYLEWSFAKGTHHYKWDKANGVVEVKWKDHSVALNLNNISKSTASTFGAELTEQEATKLYTTAWDYFNNDSFWLVAPFKVFDAGTKRSIVKLEDGSEGLLITYTNGGTTPGDSYLWELNTDGFPESYQMWVKIIPIGGIEASWNDWKEMESGVFLPTSHKLGPLNLDMGDVKAYN